MRYPKKRETGPTMGQVEQKLAAEKAEAQRLAAALAEQAEQERLAKLAAEQAEQQRLAKLAAEKAEQERLAKLAAEQAEQQRLAKLAAEQAEQERFEKLAADQAEQERLEKLAISQEKSSTPKNVLTTTSRSFEDDVKQSSKSQAIRNLLAEQKKLSQQNKLLEEKIIAFSQSQNNPSYPASTSDEDKNTTNVYADSLANIDANIDKESESINSRTLLYQASARTRLEQARLYIQSGKASEALVALKNYSPDEKNRAEYYFLTGRAYQELKLNTKALANYSIAIHLDTSHYKALNNRGLIKGALKDMPGAIDDLSKSIQANPKYAPAYMNRGVTRAAMQKFDLAIEDFTMAIVLDPAYADAYRNRGITYKFRGNIVGACRDWLKANMLGQASTKTWINRHCTSKKTKKSS